MDNLITYLHKYPKLILVEGHTDDVGREAANQLLSKQGQSIFIFIGAFIEKERLDYIGYEKKNRLFQINIRNRE